MDDSELDMLLAGAVSDLDDLMSRIKSDTDEFLRDFTKAGGETIHGEAMRRSHLRMGRLLRRAGEAYFERRGKKPPYAA